MRQEIEFFREKLLPESSIAWETPIAHIIPRMPTFTSFGDNCLEGAGGYCISLGFWWHIPFPEAVIQRTLKHNKDNKDGLLISINILEFVTVITNCCAALHFVMTTLATDDPYPVKKSSIGGNRYLVYLWELGELPVYIYWWCWRFAAPDSLRSVHSENQGFFTPLRQYTCRKIR